MWYILTYSPFSSYSLQEAHWNSCILFPYSAHLLSIYQNHQVHSPQCIQKLKKSPKTWFLPLERIHFLLAIIAELSLPVFSSQRERLPPSPRHTLRAEKPGWLIPAFMTGRYQIFIPVCSTDVNRTIQDNEFSGTTTRMEL